MADMPVCKKCGQPHWRFSSCESAPQLAAQQREQALLKERLKVRPEFTAPPGYVRVGPNKFARAIPGAKAPSYVQIAPGKFRKAGK